MNIQTYILITVILAALSIFIFILIKESNQTFKMKILQFIALIIFLAGTMFSISYIPNLPSFLGGGKVKESFSPHETVKNVKPPELKTKNVIQYKNEGLKDLDNSLKNSSE